MTFDEYIDYLDLLVETDPLQLRDEAIRMAHDLRSLFIANLRRENADAIDWAQT